VRVLNNPFYSKIRCTNSLKLKIWTPTNFQQTSIRGKKIMFHKFILILSIIGFSNALAESDSALKIISKQARGLTLELTLPPFEIVQTASCQRISIAAWGKTLKQGYPELPVKAMLLKVPQAGTINMQVIEIKEKDIKMVQNIDLCPVPKAQVSDNGAKRFHFIQNEEAYRKIFPEKVVEIGAREILRGESLSRLRIFPFQWNPETQELRYAETIRFQIQFENSILSNETPLRIKTGEILTRALKNVRENESIDSSKRQIKQNDALKIEIAETGLYQLSYEELVQAGLPQFINPKRLRLFNQGKEVALQVISESSPLKSGDSIAFYAESIDNTFTNTNVYWLYWRKKGFGKRMAQINGEITGNGEKSNAFYQHLHIENNNQFWLQTPDAPKQDYWFWERLNASDVKEYSLDIPSPIVTPSREAMMRIHFQGRSTAPPQPNHHTIIKLNGTLIGDAFWNGDATYIQEMPISSQLLLNGENTLTVEMPGDTGAIVDVIYLDWIEIDYWRKYHAIENHIAMTVTGNGETQITIKQLSEMDIIIYDITNPYEVAEIVNFSVEGSIEEEKFNYHATFETEVIGEKSYYLSRETKSPKSITPWQPAKLKAPKNGADYILITDKGFLQAVQPLIDFRRKQGLRVKSVSVQDIYNEFNHGLSNPNAIKDFLHYAYNNWNRPAPTYVFLVGDASLKYKESNSKKTNKVPTYLSASYEGLTPDDNYYVTVDGNDILPDMLIGRIPGDSSETVAALIDKIIRFEESTRENPHNVLLIADQGNDFEALNEGIFSYLPANFNADKIYLSDYLTGVDKEEREKQIAKATQNIIASFNEGVMISNYIGHGVMDRWSQSKGLFKPDDVHKLTNQEQLTFALMLTCINGYFVNSAKYSFAEEFILASGGAIATFAPSNVSYTWEDTILAHAIASLIFEDGNRIVGAITTQSKITAYEQGASANVLKMFTLFGDPAVRLKEW
jgi:hypothetical protein